MKLRVTLMIILLCCITLIGIAFYVEYSYSSDTIGSEHLIQDVPQDIMHLDTFYLPYEITGNSRIVVVHDNKRNVTCYLYNRITYGGGISCIPNSEI